ncbi:hypothetical protein BBJ29_004031 [Phytophthora kernoviae]|uniref:Uncharacterized protein n=1 Tax=Phytophthora kernoviae TaxID=325452 RepID=A0A3F2RNC9_9STRA|nr:hypothetical protein BBJ29_004031 [Phytophthora kernoviae]RLN60120.1 hypothetical protein BBP00_00006153 [Phytophthora kernoviae]
MASSQQIADLSRKIFQRLPQRNIASGNKVISKQLKGEKVASWFNKPLQLRLGGDDPNFEILNEERLGKLDQMKRRGKSIPKKGAGKQGASDNSKTMGANGQAVQTMNKRKVKLLSKKRAEVRNQKKVAVLQKGKRSTLRKHRPSKKKQQKDAKRHRIYVEGEKEKLLKSGLITKEDIEKLEAEKAEENVTEEGADVMDLEE